MAQRLHSRVAMHSAIELTSQIQTTPITEAAPLSIASEHSLVRAMIRGDEGAWRSFYDKYSSTMKRCIGRALGRMSSEDDHREVFALLLMQLIANDMHRLRMFDPERGSRFRSWIALLATHCARDYVRSSRRDREKMS